ncbi:MAG: DUF1566 domain-containing protein, partial [Nitrospirae bacterium]|nr:DUF1566 domain-containing protein [Nitrospirota bacterium]
MLMKYLQLHSGVKVLFTLMLFAMIGAMCLNTAAYAGTIQLPQTGQTTCYDASGIAIACTGTGQDGALQEGVALPNQRFTSNSDQTVTDNLTGLIWPQTANTPTVGTCKGGAMAWQPTLDYVACLNTANYLGHNDWRLPNINELESLVNAGQTNTATWLNSQGFYTVQTNYYWPSTSLAFNTSDAWFVYMGADGMSDNGKSYSSYVWPVRGGQAAAISLPQTGQTKSYDADNTPSQDDGALKKGVAWPNPRFTSNSDQTVTDNLTGLVWTDDASTPTVGSCTGGYMNWQAALVHVACLNKANYLGYNDW